MKKEIHPKYFPNAEFKCACGNKWIGGSTIEKIESNICSKCHPFYTGTEKIVDTRGRVDKYKKRLEKSAQKSAEKVTRKAVAPKKKKAK